MFAWDHKWASLVLFGFRLKCLRIRRRLQHALYFWTLFVVWIFVLLKFQFREWLNDILADEP